MYGPPTWQRVHDPTSELILTILSANSADINAEKAFDALSRRWPGARATSTQRITRIAGWGGAGFGQATPDWSAVPTRRSTSSSTSSGRAASAREGAAHPGRAAQIREERGDYSLEFLGDMSPAGRAGLADADPGHRPQDGVGRAAVRFGMPLMPVDRHVERVAMRIGLVPPQVDRLEAHDYMAALFQTSRSMRRTSTSSLTAARRATRCVRPAAGARSRLRLPVLRPKAP